MPAQCRETWYSGSYLVMGTSFGGGPPVRADSHCQHLPLGLTRLCSASTLGLQCLQAPSHSGFSSPDSILPSLPPAGFFPFLSPPGFTRSRGAGDPPLCSRSLSSFLTVRRSKVPPSHRVSLSASFLLNDTHITSLSGLLLKSASLPRFATRAAVSSGIAPLTSSGPSCFPGQTPNRAA